MISLALLLSLAGDWRPAELQVASPPAVAEAEPLLQLALSYLGRPYVSGGVGSPGFDCSGFVCRVYAEAGYAIARVSREQARVGRAVPIKRMRPGDLLFFAERGRPVSHVALYLGDGELVHASTSRGEVTVASLKGSWFQQRLVGVRRVLTSTPTAVAPQRVKELVEHAETFSLPALFRRPQRRPPPSFALALFDEGRSYVGVRAGGYLQAGAAGALVVPEASLLWEDYALVVAVQLPIAVNADGASLGPLSRWQDGLRFLRRLSLGVADADLELSLSRGADLNLGQGTLLDTAVPHLGSNTGDPSVSGLTPSADPLSVLLRWRGKKLGLQAIVDDLIEPGLFGGGGWTSLRVVPLIVEASVLSDQRAEQEGQRRAITGLEVGVAIESIERRSLSFDFGVSAAGLRAASRTGGLLRAKASLQTRLGRRRSTRVGVNVGAGFASAHSLATLWGPTYTAHRSAHYAALLGAQARGLAEAGAELGVGQFLLSAGYATGLGAGATSFDQQLRTQLELQPISLGGPRFGASVDLAWRAPFDPVQRRWVATASARLQLASWLDLEAYVARGASWTGVAAIRVAYAP